MRIARLATALIALALPCAAQTPDEPAPSVIAVGDVHGDFESFRTLLQAAGVLDAGDRWAAGSRRLIQTGDLVDRGADSRRVLELLMRLEKEAALAGGGVVVTLGNHDLWNIIGYLYYVTAGEFAAFAPDETPALREKKRRAILELLANPSTLLGSSYYRSLSVTINERTFERVFPAGYFAHREAFSPRGQYGKWLLERPIAHREGKILYLHAGISPRYAGVARETFNRQSRLLIESYFEAVLALETLGVYDAALGWERLVRLIELEQRRGRVHDRLAPHFRAITRFNASFLMEEEGLLMYRGLALGSERLLASTVRRILESHGVEHIVIGHTQPQSLRIQSRFRQRVLLIDTGLNQSVYKGRPSVLAVFPDGRLEVLE